MADEESRKIQVANSRPEDSGRGLAHVPRSLMAQLGIGEGDVIEIVGKQTTPARAVAPYPEDEGLDVLRIDGLQRALGARHDAQSPHVVSPRRSGGADLLLVRP